MQNPPFIVIIITTTQGDCKANITGKPLVIRLPKKHSYKTLGKLGYYGLSQLAHYARKRDIKLLGAVGIMVAVIVAVAPLAYYYWRLLQELYNTGAVMFGQPQLVITSALLISSFLVLLLGVPYVISVFYFSNDLVLLVPLPSHPYQILAAKTVVVWVSELIIIAPFFWIAAILYGVREGAAGTFYLLAAIIYFLTPLLPMALVTLVTMLLMRVSNLSRHKDALRLAGMFLLIIAITLISGLLGRVPPGQEAELIERILTQEEGLVIQSARIFPPVLWGTRALTATGWSQILNLGLFSIASLGTMAVALAVAQHWFFAGLIGSNEAALSGAGRRAVVRWTRGKHPAIAIMQKEMKMLVRTPIYLFNSLGIVVLLPLLGIIPLWFSGGLDLQAWQEMLQEHAGLVQLIGVAFIASLSIVAPGSSNSFSREGKHIWIAKTMPVAPRVQVQGRILQGLLATAWCLPFVVVFGMMLAGWALPQLVVVIVTGLVVSLPLILSNLLVDLAKPYLTWENPQQANKQNLNVLFGMIIGGLILLYGQGHVSYVLWERGVRAWLIMLYLSTSALGLAAILYAVLHHLSASFFDRIRS